MDVGALREAHPQLAPLLMDYHELLSAVWELWQFMPILVCLSWTMLIGFGRNPSANHTFWGRASSRKIDPVVVSLVLAARHGLRIRNRGHSD